MRLTTISGLFSCAVLALTLAAAAQGEPRSGRHRGRGQDG